MFSLTCALVLTLQALADPAAAQTGAEDDAPAPEGDAPATPEDSAPEDSEVPEAPGTLDPADLEAAQPAPIFTEDAQVAPALDQQTLSWLEPVRGKLPQNPYARRSFNAYALEWGQVRVGVGDAAVGVLPRVEVGTQPIVDAIGMYNGRAKVNALRLGPIDLAALGSYHTLPGADFSASWLQAGGLMSLRVVEPVTLHLGARWGRIQAAGVPDGSNLPGVLTAGRAEEIESWATTARDNDVSLDLQRSSLTALFALDWRFNRRDSLVLQASAMPWVIAERGTSGLDETTEDAASSIPPVMAFDELFSKGSGLSAGEAMAQSHVTSLAYQASHKNLELRLGVGTSAVRFAWLVPTLELAWTFFGETRADERRMKKTWKRNVRDATLLPDGSAEGR